MDSREAQGKGRNYWGEVKGFFSQRMSISSKEIPVIDDAMPKFLMLRLLFCEPEAIVADAGAYLFYAAAIVAKATSFSFETKTLIYVMDGRFFNKPTPSVFKEKGKCGAIISNNFTHQ